MLSLCAQKFIKPDYAEEFIQYALELVEETRKEDGNLFYYFMRSNDDPEMFAFMEQWVDETALKAHQASPHFQTYLKRIHGFESRPTLSTKYTMLA
jgi:quinol monooxygenase YgiN